MNKIDYIYKDLPLTPLMMEDLIIKIFSGTINQRPTIVDKVVAFHLQNGGLKPSAQDIPRSVKTALEKLKIKGKAVNPTHGYWKILGSEVDKLSEEKIETENSNKEEEEIEKLANKIIGEGKSSVYLYYLPLYKQVAQANNENYWHCKIGKTDRDPLLRVLSQASTALPEKPYIALILKTDYPSSLEQVLHGILTIRGRKINNSPGSEWFLTCPEEVEQIFNQLVTNFE